MMRKLRGFSVLFIVALLISVTGFATPSAFAAEDLPKTGFEMRNGESWTTLEEEYDYLTKIDELSDNVRVTQEGTSVLGKPIHLIRVGNPLLTDEEIADGRNMFIIGTPHGNEPAGREMALSLIRDIAFTEDPEMLALLKKTTFLFTPTPNPDGRQDNRRTNEWRLDNNRDNLNLTSPENEFIAGVLSYFNPDITVDLHERGGNDPDIEALWPRNLNVDAELRELNVKLVEEYVFPVAQKDGWTTGLYGSPGGAGGEDERILRNMGALRGGLTLLTESGTGTTFQKRVDMQRSVTNAAVAFYQDYFDEIATVRAGAKERRTADGIDPSVPFYLDGADNWAPKNILETKPMGYLLTKDQTNDVSKHIKFFNMETVNLSNGTFISMNQPMMTVLPFLFDERAKYNEISALPLYSLSKPGTAANMNAQITHFINEGAFADQVASRTLVMHLSAVNLYETNNEVEKVVKHMNSFKLLLDQQKATGVISNEAFTNLTTYADFIIEKWTAAE
ncbi:M14 family zinc carboxypeptidase [Sporosarcina sp. NPDC096371]|uniref:M14 family zinc carboxypeptidase n=1 Tax=Sporosarcina sp. NPDC096371 TaxID=3364530 RepID=UPI003823F5CE